MPRPEVRERVEPVRMLRPERVLPVGVLPVIRPLGAGAAPDAAAALCRAAGGIPQVEQ
jgi:hypothetical protein